MRWGALIACLFMGGLILIVTLGDRLSQLKPAAARLIAPWNAAARVAYANEALQEDTPQMQEAISELRRALQSDPLAPQALSLLAQTYEVAGAAADAFSAWEWAARVSLRDGVAQAVLIERDLKRGRVAEAIRRLDILFRGDPQTGLVLLQKLTPLLNDRPFLEALALQLEGSPPWREVMLKALSRSPGSQSDLVLDVYWRLQRGAAPPTEDEVRPLLARLVDEGRFEEAYIFWLESGRRDQRANDEFLYNARFQAPVSNLPFDWTFDATPGANVQVKRAGARRTLTVEFFGSRLGFENVSQWLLLPPGDYTFSGLEQAESVASDRGVRWRIACPENMGGDLATTPPLTGTIVWREFATTFTVPPACRAQRLVLEVPARVVLERVISGSVSYSTLSLRRQPVAAP